MFVRSCVCLSCLCAFSLSIYGHACVFVCLHVWLRACEYVCMHHACSVHAHVCSVNDCCLKFLVPETAIFANKNNFLEPHRGTFAGLFSTHSSPKKYTKYTSAALARTHESFHYESSTQSELPQPGSKVATFQYERSTLTKLLQPRLESRDFSIQK